mmetsp:Transcript_35694/g.102640  ORF Transcript_35694/g.102640 Transcript_35694/m.102640 type:complete len:91 (-) Transcript_35694:1373-1645(-)
MDVLVSAPFLQHHPWVPEAVVVQPPQPVWLPAARFGPYLARQKTLLVAGASGALAPSLATWNELGIHAMLLLHQRPDSPVGLPDPQPQLP